MVTTRRGQDKKPAAQSEPPSAKATAGPAPKVSTKGAPSQAGGTAMRVLKKYPNRRLYDTQTSGYITLSDVKAMVLEGKPFEVRDAKTSEDLTRSILLQIILEEESGGLPMFSTQTLSQIIRLYGHAMQGMMGAYLEKNMQTFGDVQQRFTDQSRGLYDPASFTPELWTQFMSGQAPMMQGLMGNYLEQSKNLFVQMQEQMTAQTGKLFPGFPTAGSPPPPSKK
jgi:polyhydroxyalkanoate synthesis repressor PhaR